MKKRFIWEKGEKREIEVIRPATKEDGYGGGFLIVKVFHPIFRPTVEIVHKSLVHRER